MPIQPVNVMNLFQTLFHQGEQALSKIPESERTQSKLKDVALAVAKSTLALDPKLALVSMRTHRLNGLDISLEGKFSDYSKNASIRAARAYVLGANVRELLKTKKPNAFFFGTAAIAMMSRYLSAENLNSKIVYGTDPATGEKETSDDIGEYVSIRKEFRAFRAGIFGKDIDTAAAECQALQNKDIVEILYEEKHVDLKPTNTISEVNEARAKEFQAYREAHFADCIIKTDESAQPTNDYQIPQNELRKRKR